MTDDEIPPLMTFDDFERETERELHPWRLPFHPAADTFPLMTEPELKALAADIKAHGLLDPILTLDGMIICGRNRCNACLTVGVEPRFDALPHGWNGDPLVLVISSNRHRKQWTGAQMAWVALGLAETDHGGARPGSGPKSDTKQRVNSSGDGPHLNSDGEKPKPRAGELLKTHSRGENPHLNSDHEKGARDNDQF
jgi:hypothetical protein